MATLPRWLRRLLESLTHNAAWDTLGSMGKAIKRVWASSVGISTLFTWWGWVWELPSSLLAHLFIGVFTLVLGAVALSVVIANGMREWLTPRGRGRKSPKMQNEAPEDREKLLVFMRTNIEKAPQEAAILMGHAHDELMVGGTPQGKVLAECIGYNVIDPYFGARASVRAICQQKEEAPPRQHGEGTATKILCNFLEKYTSTIQCAERLRETGAIGPDSNSEFNKQFWYWRNLHNQLVDEMGKAFAPTVFTDIRNKINSLGLSTPRKDPP